MYPVIPGRFLRLSGHSVDDPSRRLVCINAAHVGTIDTDGEHHFIISRDGTRWQLDTNDEESALLVDFFIGRMETEDPS